MNFKDIQDLIKLVNKLDLTEFKMRDGEFELSIRTKHYEKAKQAAAGHAAAQPAAIVPMPPVQQPFAAAAPSQPAPAPQNQSALPQDEANPAAEQTDKDLLAIRSPMVGTFYRSPAPDKGPYLKVGDTVEVGSVVCIVEAMKLFNEIESEVAGRVVKVLAEDASPVEYDQVLFLVDPKG